ncbi:MAG: ATP-binding cassette domain-containing protein [Planctomycetota bacterium]
MPSPEPHAQTCLSLAEDPARPLIRLRDIHKGFGGPAVHQGVCLDIPRGRVTVLLGPSGTGKSVLLKLVVGLLRPDAGEVWFDDHRIDQLPERQLVTLRKRVGFLFQMAALFDSLDVGANIEFPLVEHTQLKPAERAKRVARVLELVGLPGIERKMPAELSGGQRKRVALARAVVLEPCLILYDEPTTGLDPMSSDVINELMGALSREMGLTSVAVTHDLVSARKIGDRFVLLSDGKVVAEGAPAEFDASPDPLVRRFMDGQADPDDIARIRQAFGPGSVRAAAQRQAVPFPRPERRRKPRRPPVQGAAG